MMNHMEKKLLKCSIHHILMYPHLREEWSSIFKRKKTNFCWAGMLLVFFNYYSAKHISIWYIIYVCDRKGMMCYKLCFKFLRLQVAEWYSESWIFSLIIFDRWRTTDCFRLYRLNSVPSRKVIKPNRKDCSGQPL